MSKSRLAASAMLALAFALGGLAGAAATMLADTDHAPPSPHGKSRAAYLAHMRQEFIDQLKHELGLTADQEQNVIEILDRHQPAMDSLWKSVRVQFDHERQAVRQEIRGVLESGQQERFQRLLAKRDSARMARNQEGSK